jgi:phosphoheptose isomerase
VADRREHRINQWEESQSRKKAQQQETLREIEQAREQLRQKMEQHSKQLLLHNPGSGFSGLEEETREIKRRLLERRKKKENR